MSEWIFFLHPPRNNFIATMTDEERSAFAAHAAWLKELHEKGALILSGPCLGPINTGIVVFEAADESAAKQIVASEPVSRDGYMRGDLRPYRLGILRGRA
jgi:uncharacterized protein YciI